MLIIGKTKFDAGLLAGFEIVTIEVKVSGLVRPIRVRLNESDQHVFHQVFYRNDYKNEWLTEPSTIIDLGANIGYAVLWFRSKFPTCRIIAVEPDPENFRLLRENCGHLDGIQLIHAAIWHESTTIRLQKQANGHNLGSWGTRTLDQASVLADGDQVQALSMSDLLEICAVGHVDFLKVDIEGAEVEVFTQGDTRWLERVSLMAIEHHDRFRPGARKLIDQALAERAHEVAEHGENSWYRFRTVAKPG